MKILILSTSHPYKTAGVVALDVYKGLKEIEGNEVKMVVKVWANYPDKDIIPTDNYFTYFKARIVSKLHKISIKLKILKDKTIITNPNYYIQDFDQTITYLSTKKILKKAGFIPDVIIVLFMQNFLSYKNLYELNKLSGGRLYLYPMDMAPLTGGCHYAWDCDGFTKQCGNCPALYSNNSEDQSFRNLLFKKNLIQKSNISLFAANAQIADQIKKSTIFKGKEVVNGIFPVPDETVFYPRNKETARDYFKIEKNKKVFFIGTYSLKHKRKGMDVLIEALKIISEKLNKNQYDKSNILLMVAGLNFEQIKGDLPFDNRYIGFIHDYNELALAYSAADFYISPSIEDAGPTMVLQSILCGTPVISFNIGYAKDFIEDGVNGFKAEIKNALSLSECINEAILLNSNKYFFMKSQLRNIVVQISKEKVIKRIIEIVKAN